MSIVSRESLLSILKTCPEPESAAVIAKLLKKEKIYVKRMLDTLAKEGKVKRHYASEWVTTFGSKRLAKVAVYSPV